MNDALRVRKNIDHLSPEELSNYVHALKRLQEISQADPESFDGYTYLEQLHDGSAGPCEHANDTFLPWHRAHLYLFENALRKSDPPRTSNVTVPYWDWSALPSGRRFPVAFEDPTSLLSHYRNTTPVCDDPDGAGCDHVPFPRYYLEEHVLSESAWSAPAPVVLSDAPLQSFGGAAGGESNCASAFGLGFGKLEQPAHNSMHGGFIGGDMADPSSAAMDPIFWSFHAYIDLLWWQWQQMTGHVVDTGLESRLCGLYTDAEHRPENRFRVKDVVDAGALRVTYDYQRRDVPRRERLPGQLFDTHPATDIVPSGHRTPELVRSLLVTVPAPGFNRAQLNFTGVKVHTPFSYGADIYVTPEDEPFKPQDPRFRQRFLVDLLFMWKAHGEHGHHHGSAHEQKRHNIAVNVTKTLASLAEVQAGRTWKVTVALTATNGPGHPMKAALAEAKDVDANRLAFNNLTLSIK